MCVGLVTVSLVPLPSPSNSRWTARLGRRCSGHLTLILLISTLSPVIWLFGLLFGEWLPKPGHERFSWGGKVGCTERVKRGVCVKPHFLLCAGVASLQTAPRGVSVSVWGESAAVCPYRKHNVLVYVCCLHMRITSTYITSAQQQRKAACPCRAVRWSDFPKWKWTFKTS